MGWWFIVPAAIVALFLLTVLRGAPYVPTHARQIKRAFSDVYPLNSKDLLVDIGSGDGVILREAAKRGARAVGYEINPILVIISRILCRRFRERIEIKLADFWLVELPAATTLVYTFGESRDISKMYEKVQSEAARLNKTLYFMSYGFKVEGKKDIGDDALFRVYRITPGQK